jgi:glutathione-independent formaldehyde dehydrogenase
MAATDEATGQCRQAIPLEDAPRGYAELDSGAATKYVLNPDGYVAA